MGILVIVFLILCAGGFQREEVASAFRLPIQIQCYTGQRSTPLSSTSTSSGNYVGLFQRAFQYKTNVYFSSNNTSGEGVIPPELVSNPSRGVSKEYLALKARIDKLEKSLALVSTTSTGGNVKSKTKVDSFVDAITASTIQINAKTVELFAVISFFGIGAFVGASLLDRLWLLGGICGAWWASGAVKGNTRAGALARQIGARTALVVQELQEKYNQAIIFYRTGKLAYVSSKVWEQYDQKYYVTQRFNAMKKLALKRAAEFNTAMGNPNFYTPLRDFWRVAIEKPEQMKVELEQKYHIRRTFENVYKTVSAQSKDALNRIFAQQDEKMSRTMTSNKKLDIYGRSKANAQSVGNGNVFSWLTENVGRTDTRRRNSVDEGIFSKAVRQMQFSTRNAINILFDLEVSPEITKSARGKHHHKHKHSRHLQKYAGANSAFFVWPWELSSANGKSRKELQQQAPWSALSGFFSSEYLMKSTSESRSNSAVVRYPLVEKLIAAGFLLVLTEVTKRMLKFILRSILV